jgi:thiazole synthase
VYGVFKDDATGEDQLIVVYRVWVLRTGKERTVNDPLVIAGKEFHSRLMSGTGRFRNNDDMLAALEASGTQIVTVAIRRLDLDNPNDRNILELIIDRYTILPNTAGSKTPDEAVFTAKLGREVTGTNWVKLEVIPDPKFLFPDPQGTLRAAERSECASGRAWN